METHTLHRGRLIDHLQLVVKDLTASERFYRAILATLDVPIGGAGEEMCIRDSMISLINMVSLLPPRCLCYDTFFRRQPSPPPSSANLCHFT